MSSLTAIHRRVNARSDPLHITVVAAVLIVALYLGRHGPLFNSQNEPWWMAVVGLAILITRYRQLPLLAWTWWAAGLLTLLWSQAPGHTLLAGVWEALYLAAFLAGRSQLGASVVLGALLVNGLYANLVSMTLNGPFYLSGSGLYMSGAQALALLPACLAFWARGGPLSWLAALGGALSLYAIGISGARAVYLPTLLVLALFAWRALKEGTPLRSLFVGTVILACSTAALDRAIPNHPLAHAVGMKGARTFSGQDSTGGGNFQTRLQMWELAASVAAERPWGTGNGSYAVVVQSYQKWPIFFSRFAHNLYLETLATGGLLRLLVLLALLGTVLLAGWRSNRWPWALGAAGLWATFAFDITGNMPPVMVSAFLALGAALPAVQSPSASVRFSKSLKEKLAIAGLLLVSVVIGWWYWPCGDTTCKVKQRLAWTPDLQQATQNLSSIEREAMMESARMYYPNSYPLELLNLHLSRSAEDREHALLLIINRYPYASIQNYHLLADLYARKGQTAQAHSVLSSGVERFSTRKSPLGLTLVLDAESSRKVEQARKRLGELASRLEAAPGE